MKLSELTFESVVSYTFTEVEGEKGWLTEILVAENPKLEEEYL